MKIGAIRANRFEPIDSQKHPSFIKFERLSRIASNLRFATFNAPKRDLHKKGFSSGTLNRFVRIRPSTLCTLHFTQKKKIARKYVENVSSGWLQSDFIVMLTYLFHHLGPDQSATVFHYLGCRPLKPMLIQWDGCACYLKPYCCKPSDSDHPDGASDFTI